MNKIIRKILKTLYKAKFYINIPITQASFITGKIPELMSTLWLLEYFGVNINKQEIPITIIVITIALIIIGKIWKQVGIYDIEINVNAQKNPVQEKLLRAANIIIKENEK